MKLFSLIMFGLAVIRTITPFAKDETYQTATKFLGQLGVAITMIMAYVWLIKQFVIFK